MGDCISGSICIAGSVVGKKVGNLFSKWLCGKWSYIQNLPENLASLERAMKELKAKRDDVHQKVEIAEQRRGLQRTKEVKLWLQNVRKIEKEFDALSSKKSVELGRFFLCGLCSKSLRSSYQYGESVCIMLKEVADLIKAKESLKELAGLATTSTRVERPLDPNIVGQERLLAAVWQKLNTGEVGTMALYGMGGVGKTILLEQINNKFSSIKSSSELLIWVSASKYLRVDKIQDEISKILGLYEEGWKQKTESEKSMAIYNFMKRKRFFLLLDDIWKKVDLKKIGVPHPTRENRCKVVFTTRSRDVCGLMGVHHHQTEVKLLPEDDAWDLFKKKVGENTLGRHVEIRQLAKEIAKTCHGLPLALSVIGETMASKTTVGEWRHAIRVLSSSSSSTATREIAGIEENLLQVLKYSYDGLSGTDVKSCFRYCALFPAASAMKKNDLIDYWICENILDVNQSRQSAMDRGYAIINELVRACLLRNVDISGRYVKMHTVVQKMASWVATDLGTDKEKRVVHANNAELRHVPTVTNWGRVCRMLLMNTGIAKLSGSPDCSRLTTLLLQQNRNLVHIRGEFFNNMPNIRVLNLSSTNLKQVPKQLSDLNYLRFLDLSSTEIENLPDGLEKLKRLIHLNLERTCRLRSVGGISKVPLLRVLRLRSSKCLADLNTVNELKSMGRLEVVTIDTSSTSALEELLKYNKLANSVQRLSIVEVRNNLVLSATDGLIDLTIRSCSTLKVEIQRSSSRRSFHNLSTVCISSCDGLKELTWLLFAPNLTVLELRGLKKLQEIMNKEKAEPQLQGEATLQRLKTLELSDLPMLKQIYWSALPFPCLKNIKVRRCPKLRRLPLDSKSCDLGKPFTIQCNDENWIKSIQWKDRATNARFKSCCLQC